jgi:lipoprotein signal peptidase
MATRGAGGTEGGTGKFFLGLSMFALGGFLFLDAVQVSNQFSLSYSLYQWGPLRVTSGFMLIPFLIGVGMIFFNARNYLGWLLAIGSLLMLVVGIITSLSFHLRTMSVLELLMILVLLAGGLGLFLSSLHSHSR